MTAVAGAVLAGGRSRRMGRDKALVTVDGRAMAARVAGALRAGGCEPVAMIGGDTVALAALGFEVVGDRWPGEGPLGAIVTALEHFQRPTLVVACDMPWLDEHTVRRLLQRAASEADATSRIDVALAVTDRDEPMCACWTTNALPLLREAFAQGERAVHRAMTSLAVARVAVPAASLRNVNTQADLPPCDGSG